MHVADHRVVRDFRRFELALRLIELGVRSSIVQDWTGLSVTRVMKLRRAAAHESTSSFSTKRGPPPRDVRILFRSRAVRDEATAAAVALWSYGVIPEERGRIALRDLPGVVRGERLLAAYQAYRLAVPNALLNVEQLVLIVAGLTQGTSLRLGECVRCRTPLLVQPDRLRRNSCLICLDTHRAASFERDRVRHEAEDPQADDDNPMPQQVSLF